jgi:hypothetical protein
MGKYKVPDATKLTKEQILRKTTDMACQDGNWDYDSYMHGYANGLLLACKIILGEGDFLNPPAAYLKDEN